MNFPITCVDNFYQNPDEIRNFALSLEYKKQPGNYPGLRTNYMHEVDNIFFNKFCSKLFSLFFNYEKENIEWSVDTCFQQIHPYSEDSHSLLNSGWYHEDSDNNIAAGVIYLNPLANLDAGTTIGELKSENRFNINSYDWRNKFYKKVPNQQRIVSCLEREDFNSEFESPDENIYQHMLLDHNSNFYKTAEFKNVYNRLILYDAKYWHKESNFFASESEPRLTQIFFINRVVGTSNPIQKINNFDI